jgi:hypothetical protein
MFNQSSETGLKKKLTKLEIFFFFLNIKNKKQIHAYIYIQTDRNVFRQRKNAQKKDI